MKHAIIFILLTLLSPLGHSQDLDSFEQRMYNIYKKSYSHEVSDQEWQKYIANVNQRVYQINQGDTLWGLSKIFFGDGFYWPKIWSYNSKLTNPHLLRVGQNIQFFAGSVEEPPEIVLDSGAQNLGAGGTSGAGSLPSNIPKGFKEVVAEGAETETIVQTEEQNPIEAKSWDQEPIPPLSAAEQKSLRKGLYPGAPKLPAPRTRFRPVLNHLPTSFNDAVSYDATQFNAQGMSFDLRPPVRVNPLFVTPNFLYGGDAMDYPWVGRILESENQNSVIGLNDEVFVRSKENLKIGDVYTIMGKTYDFDRNGFVGDVIDYMGKMQIEDVVDKDEKIYQGVVVHSIAAIRRNAFITREQIPSFEDDYVGRPADIKLKVIGGGLDNISRIYGQSDVIYLGGGSDKGVRVGDIMGIYKRRDIRYEDVDVKRSPQPIGHIKVFRSEPELASAFVINSSEVIVPGDETGPPTMVEGITTQSEKEDLNQLESGLDFSTGPAPSNSELNSLEEELSEIE